MRRCGKLVVASWFCAAPLGGQTVSVPVSEAKVGHSSALVLNLEPSGKGPTALQWEMLIPPVVRIDPAEVSIGKAAGAAGKSVRCEPKQPKASGEAPVRYTCILAGGINPIAAGAVASVRYRVLRATDPPIRIAIENILAVFVDLHQVTLPNVDAVIRVR